MQFYSGRNFPKMKTSLFIMPTRAIDFKKWLFKRGPRGRPMTVSFWRVDVSLFTFQYGGFENGESFQDGHGP